MHFHRYGVMNSKGPLTTFEVYLWPQKETRSRQQLLQLSQWLTKLFTSEADDLVDDFGNNLLPDVGTQSYSGDTHDKGDCFN